jgi:hypothetical protein
MPDSAAGGVYPAALRSRCFPLLIEMQCTYARGSKLHGAYVHLARHAMTIGFADWPGTRETIREAITPVEKIAAPMLFCKRCNRIGWIAAMRSRIANVRPDCLADIAAAAGKGPAGFVFRASGTRLNLVRGSRSAPVKNGKSRQQLC